MIRRQNLQLQLRPHPAAVPAVTLVESTTWRRQPSKVVPLMIFWAENKAILNHLFAQSIHANVVLLLRLELGGIGVSDKVQPMPLGYEAQTGPSRATSAEGPRASKSTIAYSCAVSWHLTNVGSAMAR